jgi:RNA polymerase sigma-70 factor (ECF subfamily)
VSDTATRARPCPDAAADQHLTRAAAGGDDSARRTLARRLLERTRVTVRYLLGDGPDAQDLVQICLIEVLRSAHTFRGESRLETWADRVVTRTALRELRRRRARPEALMGDVAEALVERHEPATDLDRNRVRTRMVCQLEKLSPERRTVLVLHVVLGHTVPEIARMIEASEHTVWDRLKKGKQKLRKLILADGILREWAGVNLS